MAGGSRTRRGQPQPYRRRRPLPALVLLLVLAVTTGVIWLRVINNDSMRTTSAPCGPPTSSSVSTAPGSPPPAMGQLLASDALDRSTPTPPARVYVRVVNASPQRGQAAEVTEALRQLGFGQIEPPANDPLYPSFDLACRAQIRFGPQGTAAARTLSLVEPCAELIRDDRPDESVELALGRKFDDLKPRNEARKILLQLTEWALQNPETRGGLQEAATGGPELDGRSLAAARQVTC